MARVTLHGEITLANPPDQRATPAPRRASAQLEYADASLEGRRPALLLAAAAGLCWACAIALLLSGGLDAETDPLAAQRVIFYVLVLAAGLLTFVPIQQRLRLPGLALEGVAGTALLFYTLAFVPPPTGWLLALPDTPVYIVFIAAVFWSSAAIALPPMYALGRWTFRQRARQYDLRRARRQAHEVGVLLAAIVALAGLRLLTPFGVALIVLILVVAEMLFLSFVETEA
ncbi:MAG TPA: hypothetical protein VFX76_20200 [Roseiflexaceae bacterium]|nr:hypothetical protein [Roseiflexaceae bacterium]